MDPKSKLINKRKSRTPGGKNRRKSKVIMAQAAREQLAAAVVAQDSTMISTTRTFLQTTSSTLSTTNASGASTSSTMSRQQIQFASNYAKPKKAVGVASSLTHAHKNPPVCASAKYAAAASSITSSQSSKNVDRMTSTAHNTFLDEESFTALERACDVTNRNSGGRNLAQAAAAKISQMISDGGENRFNIDPNYMEFSRNLPKQKSSFMTLGDATNTGRQAGINTRSGTSKLPSLTQKLNN